MDFSKHDSRTAAENPQPLKLRDPATGEYIKDGDEFCTVMVIGSHARSVQAGILEDARNKPNNTKGKKKKDDDAKALADIQKTLVEGAGRLIRGFANIERDGKPLTTSKEDIEWFLDLNFLSVKSLLETDNDNEEKWLGDSFAQQVLKASNDASAYLGKE